MGEKLPVELAGERRVVPAATERAQRIAAGAFTDHHHVDLLVRLYRGHVPVIFQRCQLVHAVDLEGLGRGIDETLVADLAAWTPIPITYAGGARSLADLETVTRLGQGRVDLTIGSALDIFGGAGVRYVECVAFNRRVRPK